MLTPELFRAKFAVGAPFGAYLETAKSHERSNWNASHARVVLTDHQRQLIESFTRRINALVLSGTWCGDCVQQVPMLDHIARAGSTIDLRLLDRDSCPDLAEALRIAGGRRVPTVVFLNEDFEFVSILGDRTLSRYRQIAQQQLGAACPLPGAALGAEEAAQTLSDWVNEFERVHLLLRLSPKLRQRYGD